MDADDYFNYCSKDIFDEYVNSNADIIFFKINSVDCDMYTTKIRVFNFNKYVDYWINSSKKSEALLKYRHPSVLSKLFRTDLIKNNGILFDETLIGNDITFAYLAGFHANTISADPRSLYCTTVRQGSIRQKKKKWETKLDELYVAVKRYVFYKNNKIIVSPNIIQDNSLIILSFFNRQFKKKAFPILRLFELTNIEIMKIFFLCIFIYIPKVMIFNLSSRHKRNLLK